MHRSDNPSTYLDFIGLVFWFCFEIHPLLSYSRRKRSFFLILPSISFPTICYHCCCCCCHCCLDYYYYYYCLQFLRFLQCHILASIFVYFLSDSVLDSWTHFRMILLSSLSLSLSLLSFYTCFTNHRENVY
ncbi:hypothetical protein SSS_09538 [Sarcoptes scabiei]|nr:hypothetical protein SSS_09538 [Sarcoptes scabiei]